MIIQTTTLTLKSEKSPKSDIIYIQYSVKVSVTAVPQQITYEKAIPYYYVTKSLKQKQKSV